MVQKALIVAMALCLVTVLGFGQGNLVVPYVYKAASPVVIDGDLSEWNFCFPIDFSRESISPQSRSWTVAGWIPGSDDSLSGRLYMMYDDNYFYFAASVRDNTPGMFSEANWSGDAVEFYMSSEALAANATGGAHANLVDDAVTHVYDTKIEVKFRHTPAPDSVVIYRDDANGAGVPMIVNPADIKFQVWDAGDGYTVEGRIPWDSLQSHVTGNSVKFVEGTRVAATWSLFGMDASHLSSNTKVLQYSTNAVPPWQGAQAWQVMDIFGAPNLPWDTVATFNFVKPYIKKVASGKTPVIDGNLQEWNFCFPIDMNHESLPAQSRSRTVAGWLPATDADLSSRLYMMYDDNYFYFAASVRDATPGMFSEANWSGDAVEFYMSSEPLASNAYHGAHAGLVDDAGTHVYDTKIEVKFRHTPGPDSVVIYRDDANGAGVPMLWNPADITFLVWDAGDGYTVEGRIPWDSLNSHVTGNSVKAVAGTRVAGTWSTFGMDATHLSSNTLVLQYSPNTVPPWQGAQAWQYMDVDNEALLELVGLTSVENISKVIPDAFKLLPAYPNPFNPSTNIEYTLVKSGITSLKVYNILGQLVQTVIDNTNQAPGTYKVSVDMSRVSSGIYFYTLEQGQNRSTQKMVLLK